MVSAGKGVTGVAKGISTQGEASPPTHTEPRARPRDGGPPGRAAGRRRAPRAKAGAAPAGRCRPRRGVGGRAERGPRAAGPRRPIRSRGCTPGVCWDSAVLPRRPKGSQRKFDRRQPARAARGPRQRRGAPGRARARPVGLGFWFLGRRGSCPAPRPGASARAGPRAAQAPRRRRRAREKRPLAVTVFLSRPG
ncbi:MAG: hypothetical protein J3K34DRAFT_271916 [Monoraphidium minutum]|nr:MAG: hypothetical protein J3K34DRAFT_271916 [Monoraphidium minutum]